MSSTCQSRREWCQTENWKQYRDASHDAGFTRSCAGCDGGPRELLSRVVSNVRVLLYRGNGTRAQASSERWSSGVWYFISNENAVPNPRDSMSRHVLEILEIEWKCHRWSNWKIKLFFWSDGISSHDSTLPNTLDGLDRRPGLLSVERPESGFSTETEYFDTVHLECLSKTRAGTKTHSDGLSIDRDDDAPRMIRVIVCILDRRETRRWFRQYIISKMEH